jgi:hypothetical protein
VGNARPRVDGCRRAGSVILAALFAVTVVATPGQARAQATAPTPSAAAPPPAQTAAPSTPEPAAPAESAQAAPVRATPAQVPAAPALAAPAYEPAPVVASPADVAAQEKADCSRELAIAETAIARDAKYARNWTDAWYVTGTSLVALNLVNVFQYHDYRKSEAIVFAALSTLLMIQLPTATSSGKALQGIRSAGFQDPCLALTNARYVLEVNADDARLHTNAFAYVFPIVLNVLAASVVALAEGHWEFAGHGDEGLSTLVGIAAGELQVLTYPRSSLKVSGSSLQMSF